MSIFRKILGGIAPGIAGAVLGFVMGIMQMEQLVPVHYDVDILPFQNFAIYMGLGFGLFLGLVSYAAFMALYKRYQYPASSRLGAWSGAAAGALLCFCVNLILNVSADSFDFVRSDARGFIFTTVFTSLVGGVVGLVAGYFMAEIGARNLHYR